MERLSYKPLKQASISPTGCFIIDVLESAPVKRDTPAIVVMTDLSKIQTITIDPGATLAEANHVMLSNKVHQLIVIGMEGRVKGVLTTNDLWSERPVQISQKRGVTHGELLVRDIMTPVESIDVLKLYDVEHAEVGHIVETLKAAGRIHALVVEEDASGAQKLRGIFSASQIARLIGVEVISHETARTFAEIEAAIA